MEVSKLTNFFYSLGSWSGWIDVINIYSDLFYLLFECVGYKLSPCTGWWHNPQECNLYNYDTFISYIIDLSLSRWKICIVNTHCGTGDGLPCLQAVLWDKLPHVPAASSSRHWSITKSRSRSLCSTYDIGSRVTGNFI